MLDDSLKAQLKGYLERISQPVEIIASADGGDKSREMLELLADIGSVSDLVRISVLGDAEAAGSDAGGTAAGGIEAPRRPSFCPAQGREEARVRFAGLPMGHEFTSLVLALLQTGGYPPKVEPAVVEQIRNLDGEYHFETFVSLTCQSCPDVVQALNVMAVLNPRIRHTMIDGAEFQEEVERRQVYGGAGRVPERPALRPGPHGTGGNTRKIGFRRGGARRLRVERQGAL